ncbi:hypothetical protein EB73_36175 [Mycobacterium sp. SWH-M3]|nr:hypothetical protein EB73_36175 [Mycobacterium sp. SWH-M3]
MDGEVELGDDAVVEVGTELVLAFGGSAVGGAFPSTKTNHTTSATTTTTIMKYESTSPMIARSRPF